MLVQIIVPAAVFTLLILALSATVLAARAQLAPTGRVVVDVNGRHKIEVGAGRKLLWALAENGIFLPAACGGRGTCGQCRVTVLAGGGPPLPTEAPHLTAAEAAAGVRLACMLTLREPLGIRVPDATLEARRWTCSVIASRSVATYLKEVTLRLPRAEQISFVAGDYVLLEAPAHRIPFREIEIDAPYREEWARTGLLGLESVAPEPVVRAYSLANPPQESDRIVLVVRIATPPAAVPDAPPGAASSYIFALRPGDEVGISGPFGDFHVQEGDGEIVFIAGGAGIAPIRSMILDQLARGTTRKMSFWYGCRDASDLCYFEELAQAAREHPNFEFHAALSSPRPNDHWEGDTGFIHRVAYDRYLESHPAPASVGYYLCGPPVMTAAVVHMLETLGVARASIFFDDFGS